jgi:hypothetical protein
VRDGSPRRELEKSCQDRGETQASEVSADSDQRLTCWASLDYFECLLVSNLSSRPSIRVTHSAP